jgi:hypothetical protein
MQVLGAVKPFDIFKDRLARFGGILFLLIAVSAGSLLPVVRP